jgi:hypothetical protein
MICDKNYKGSQKPLIPIVFQSELQQNIEIIPTANQYRKLLVLIFAMVYANTYLKCL